ncbi:hypothetical protein [Conchiformibius kuhniae]|uniref:Lipoprotein n=1 Tax=Conchiformibius kuhniae TaxID=211502 RepID=A0A8T9N0G6_9NEIS|nr:hypothetical protein [Conchiformibius kuhniae]UOP05493.1 hypothetical protein LVJ77_04950 [Conchiformibius kuhniae]
MLKHINQSAWILALASGLTACVVAHAPSVSSSVIETDEQKGSLIGINAKYCFQDCDTLMLDKVKEVCAAGYTIQSREITQALRSGNMVVRCRPPAKAQPQQGSTLQPIH